MKEDELTVLWDSPVHTDRSIHANKPNIMNIELLEHEYKSSFNSCRHFGYNRFRSQTFDAFWFA